MLSHEACSAGGNHEFAEPEGDDWFNGEIMVSHGCSKCSEVHQNEMLVRDGHYEYNDCEPDDCQKSSDGHDWHDDGHEYSSPDQYFKEKCHNCGGTRTEWYRHKYTTYNGPDGQEFHRHQA